MLSEELPISGRLKGSADIAVDTTAKSASPPNANRRHRPINMRIIMVKPRPVRYAIFLDGIGPGRLDDRWSRRGLRY
jgi:hypothetical protein